MFKKNMKKAFTLVEMLIVIIIIGILMGALLPKLKGAQERARDTARKANLTTLSTALEMYFNDEGVYPTGDCLKDISPKLSPTYISDLPSDPQKARKAYGTKNGGCTKWDYAYTSLYRKWWKDAGAVLIANIEADGTVGNFILPQKTANDNSSIVAVFSGSADKTIIDGVGISSDTNISGLGSDKMVEAANVTKSTVLRAANYAEKLKCSSTKLASDVASSTMCNRVSTSTKVTEGKAGSNNSMVYVLFN